MNRCRISFLLLLMMASVVISTAAKTIDITLTEAMKQNLVTITSISSGEVYNAKGLQLKIVNNGKKTLNISIDPALIFVPTDTSYQDLLVVGDIKTVVAPSSSNNVLLQTYCAKSYASGPAKDLSYHFNKQADSVIIKTLAYAKKRGINAEITQKAVWVLTDKTGLNNIYDPSNDIASKELAMYVGHLLGKGMPEYYNYHKLNTTPNEPVVSKKALSIYALFKWEQKAEDKLSLGVYDEKGNETQKMFEEQSFKVGGYELNAKFESSNEPAGTYFIRLSSSKGVIKETKVVVE